MRFGLHALFRGIFILVCKQLRILGNKDLKSSNMERRVKSKQMHLPFQKHLGMRHMNSIWLGCAFHKQLTLNFHKQYFG